MLTVPSRAAILPLGMCVCRRADDDGATARPRRIPISAVESVDDGAKTGMDAGVIGQDAAVEGEGGSLVTEVMHRLPPAYTQGIAVHSVLSSLAHFRQMCVCEYRGGPKGRPVLSTLLVPNTVRES